jgi:hypothetical protein
VFLQNYSGLEFIVFKGIIFLLEIPWNMSTVSWTGSMRPAHGSTGLHQMRDVHSVICGRDLKAEGVFSRSNRGRTS